MPKVEDRDDIRMGEIGGCTRLLKEAISKAWIGDQGITKDFERYIALQVQVTCPEDGCHATLAQEFEDLVSSSKNG